MLPLWMVALRGASLLHNSSPTHISITRSIYIIYINFIYLLLIQPRPALDYRSDPTISGPIAHIDHLVDPEEVIPLTKEETSAGQMLLGIFGGVGFSATAESASNKSKLDVLDEKKEKVRFTRRFAYRWDRGWDWTNEGAA